jgi:F420-dependent oxidoreductase-like protein
VRIGLFLGDPSGPDPVGELTSRLQAARDGGFATAWVPQLFSVDALTALAVAGRAVPDVEVGTAVVPTYPRHPLALAQQALTVQAATGGRFVLGIGLSHQVVIEGMFGLPFDRPAAHMREYLSVLVPLLREQKVSFAGSLYRVNASVNMPGTPPCPVVVAALGPKMLALAGTMADGTITWMTGPRTLASHTVPRITEAAREAGRPEPRVVCGLPVCVTDDEAAARERAARLFAGYGTLPSYRAMLDREGVEGPADVAIVGDEARVRAELARLAEAGVTDFCAAPFARSGSPDAERTRALLAELARG